MRVAGGGWRLSEMLTCSRHPPRLTARCSRARFRFYWSDKVEDGVAPSARVLSSLPGLEPKGTRFPSAEALGYCRASPRDGRSEASPAGRQKRGTAETRCPAVLESPRIPGTKRGRPRGMAETRDGRDEVPSSSGVATIPGTKQGRPCGTAEARPAPQDGRNEAAF